MNMNNIIGLDIDDTVLNNDIVRLELEEKYPYSEKFLRYIMYNKILKRNTSILPFTPYAKETIIKLYKESDLKLYFISARTEDQKDVIISRFNKEFKGLKYELILTGSSDKKVKLINKLGILNSYIDDNPKVANGVSKTVPFSFLRYIDTREYKTNINNKVIQVNNLKEMYDYLKLKKII